ncbi:MAG: hypothetical protein D3917_09640 [Candidatus Electrothrix sp. AX5]|jgi:hypothetical protein|uniref:Uncharacterized protein n=1 Tax=Candidatus Electrothrix aarhusensis TaxID=1859131 RepID=A0A444IRQ6_9BACT|nr:hypothetical protein [Candidatus Electrothrix sp. AX5]RWX43462.1 hypothetical protein H206_01590 [Candidatus Electrothrix aarhusensis]
MTASRKKIYAFERSIQLIEKAAQNNSFLVSDESFQALYNTYEKLVEMFPVADEARTDDFLVLQV